MKLTQRVAGMIGVLLMCSFEFYDIRLRSKTYMKAQRTRPGLNVPNVPGQGGAGGTERKRTSSCALVKKKRDRVQHPENTKEAKTSAVARTF